MKRLFSLVVLTAVMAATMALSSAALADPSPPDSGNPSCFGEASRLTPGGPGPGASVSTVTTGATAPHGANSVDYLAREVGLIQQIRRDVCPTGLFPEQ